MNSQLVKQLYDELDRLPILDPHTHIRPKHSSALNAAEILSYHYYTELINATELQPGGFPTDDPRRFTKILVEKLPLIKNTVQFDWLMTISELQYGIDRSEWTADSWESIYDRIQAVIDASDYTEQVIAKSNISAVFLTNSYNEDLSGVDTTFYTPCLRVDPFMSYASTPAEWPSLSAFAGVDARTVEGYGAGLDKAFARFAELGMAYAAWSSPPNLQTGYVSAKDAGRVLSKAVAGAKLDADEEMLWAAYATNQIAARCRQYGKPFHLMIGVNRGTYVHGVPSGTDLFDSINSMKGFDYLFNEFVDVNFPTSVLSDTTGLELTAAAWIRHNVMPSGHWWYSNQPTDIARELERRLNAVPLGKLIGYYSDAYYLEFVAPKFKMYKFELAKALADRIERSQIHPNMVPFSVDAALEVAEQVLIGNPKRSVGLG
jgi:glucuronate isomerase